ncbi:hypothetical protein Q6W56_004553 [Salmonella enterica]|uniref:hypothetical protein n=1 Tax=Salmonella enterica TaxID=28901 RepID=UPI0010106DF8|nr:hypothetical protein [Salmonella enterica]ECC3256282.1 hypothetical protein [Salmonella enterica subsp. enterica]EDS4738701.1 hypothetical protein [Salmonella enterica subsp. enterica serovar Oranienburg]EDU6365501.1 hypothetical protein [Salmonella enterica subsp. enterica serovar Florian]EGX8054721.1 hypothetical protein [Salmonella enterica subsp. enterica serovar Inganda]EAS1760909.1 hypothetical protein [Salmonella enterica]
MSEEELIEMMHKNDFSWKQIDRLKRLSEKYSTSLYDTVLELARRFPRSLFLHIVVFFLTVHTYIRFSKQYGYLSWHIIFFIGVLCLMFTLLNLFAPLIRGYKARKIIKEIQRKEKP